MHVVVGLIGLVALLILARTLLGQTTGAMGGAPPGTPAEATRFAPVETVAALDPLFAQSAGAPVILFLHDPSCPISAGAYRRMTHLGGEVALVNVQRAHDISRTIETRTGVRHESPQVIVLQQGRAVWSASHSAITATAVAAAAREV